MTQKVAVFTVRSAAAELGVSTTQVYAWLKDGTLERAEPLGEDAVGVGRPALISADSVFALKRRRALGGPEA